MSPVTSAFCTEVLAKVVCTHAVPWNRLCSGYAPGSHVQLAASIIGSPFFSIIFY